MTIRQARRAIIHKIRRSGVELMKAPANPYDPIPVFKLCAERLMQLRGDSLRFVQVGANDGLYGDPIRPYILSRGWQGILVEPQAGVFSRLRENYAGNDDRLIFENLAIGSGGDLVLYHPAVSVPEGPGIPHGLTVTSSDPDVVSRQTGIAKTDLVKITVPCVTLDELIERHDYYNFDVLQIDVEGYDLDVLLTLSLDRSRPGLIQFEHGHLDRSQITRAVEHLTHHGYKFYYGGRQFNDSVAMPAELFD